MHAWFYMFHSPVKTLLWDDGLWSIEQMNKRTLYWILIWNRILIGILLECIWQWTFLNIKKYKRYIQCIWNSFDSLCKYNVSIFSFKYCITCSIFWIKWQGPLKKSVLWPTVNLDREQRGHPSLWVMKCRENEDECLCCCCCFFLLLLLLL